MTPGSRMPRQQCTIQISITEVQCGTATNACVPSVGPSTPSLPDALDSGFSISLLECNCSRLSFEPGLRVPCFGYAPSRDGYRHMLELCFLSDALDYTDPDCITLASREFYRLASRPLPHLQDSS